MVEEFNTKHFSRSEGSYSLCLYDNFLWMRILHCSEVDMVPENVDLQNGVSVFMDLEMMKSRSKKTLNKE